MGLALQLILVDVLSLVVELKWSIFLCVNFANGSVADARGAGCLYKQRLVYSASRSRHYKTYVNEPDWLTGGLLPLRQSFNQRSRANRSGSAGSVDDDVMLARRFLQKLYIFVETVEEDWRHALRLVVLCMFGLADEDGVGKVFDVGMG